MAIEDEFGFEVGEIVIVAVNFIYFDNPSKVAVRIKSGLVENVNDRVF